MPYGAPESYYPIDGSSFSSKNDIFSLGVISSEMTNHRLPFYFFNEGQHFERYTEQNIEDFWFSSPE
jgi:serine/threonine protein kinase